jgi:hypothetical protein
MRSVHRSSQNNVGQLPRLRRVTGPSNHQKISHSFAKIISPVG